VKRRAVRLLGLLAATIVLTACEREMRRFDTPPAPLTSAAPAGRITPGPEHGPVRSVGATPAHYTEANAWSVSQGRRWFRWYNCNGCHSAGGGGMGPPLMDDAWRYGASPEQIAASIRDGRPNGMPAFGSRIPDDQIAQITAYVRSMSGQLRVDVASSRGDALSPGAEPELRREKLEPRPEKQ
jgi:cytochrome c oxidase cbb3-type subunit 3